MTGTLSALLFHMTERNSHSSGEWTCAFEPFGANEDYLLIRSLIDTDYRPVVIVRPVGMGTAAAVEQCL